MDYPDGVSNQLESRFKIGDTVTITAKVAGIQFSDAKVRYAFDLGPDLSIVDSEYVQLAAPMALEPVPDPVRQIALIVTHDSLGDGRLSPLLQEAFIEMFVADPWASQMNFEAGNGIKIQTIHAKHYVPQIGETKEDAV